jgi:hypothetical protein
MVTGEVPAGTILVDAQSVTRIEIPPEHLAAPAAIQANDKIAMNGSPDLGWTRADEAEPARKGRFNSAVTPMRVALEAPPAHPQIGELVRRLMPSIEGAFMWSSSGISRSAVSNTGTAASRCWKRTAAPR